MTVVHHMQDDFRTEDDQLGQGINCSVLACHSTALAGVVLKKGPSLVLADEVKMMRPCLAPMRHQAPWNCAQRGGRRGLSGH